MVEQVYLSTCLTTYTSVNPSTSLTPVILCYVTPQQPQNAQFGPSRVSKTREQGAGIPPVDGSPEGRTAGVLQADARMTALLKVNVWAKRDCVGALCYYKEDDLASLDL